MNTNRRPSPSDFARALIERQRTHGDVILTNIPGNEGTPHLQHTPIAYVFADHVKPLMQGLDDVLALVLKASPIYAQAAAMQHVLEPDDYKGRLEIANKCAGQLYNLMFSNQMREILAPSEVDKEPLTAADDGWKDMTTAPRDGTRVDLWVAKFENPDSGFRMADCCWDGKHWRDSNGEVFLAHRVMKWRNPPPPPAK